MCGVRYPLQRGANFVVSNETATKYDSSPPARGRLCIILRRSARLRFSPSCEGQTKFTKRKKKSAAIHPLLRGADKQHSVQIPTELDSSPPARGRHQKHIVYQPDSRFIPSCEGQTFGKIQYYYRETIHPLLRGADSQSVPEFLRQHDSSPPARGRPVFQIRPAVVLRFIPSCEGQTSRARGRKIVLPIHPLLRGADCYSDNMGQLQDDSSPPAKGRRSFHNVRPR